ncbi:MAG: hypothetical protein ACRDNF_01060 [Streptosporangiaceae bacterium]
MHTFGLLWQVFVHAGIPARLVIAAVVLLAASGVQHVLEKVDQLGYWLDARRTVAWQRQRLRAQGRCELCAQEPAATEWAGTGELIGWACLERKREAAQW